MIEIELFTDPACPFAFSHEPVRRRLRWQYGDGLRWTTRMIVLTREAGEAEKLAGGAPSLQRRFGMPIDPRPAARPASSEPACRAVVAARLWAPDRAAALLRFLRVRVMAGGLLDDPELIAAAAADAGLDAEQLSARARAEDVGAALEDDVAAARRPSAAARALDHKLGGPTHERRYTAPSYLIDGVAVPGFNPVEVYETVIANRDPALPRRPAPAGVDALLAWAQAPLATAEAALILGVEIDRARELLSAAADFRPAGADGYWTPRAPRQRP